MPRLVLRPEKPKIAMFGVLAFICAYFIVVAVAWYSTDSPRTPITWVVVAVLFCVVGAAVRGMMQRVIADEQGVEVLNVFRRRRYTWHDIDDSTLPGGSATPVS